MQAKLLHVLQDHQYSRLGGRQLIEVDVRVFGGDERGSARSDEVWQVPRGPLLSAERAFDSDSALARAHSGNSDAVPPFPEAVQREI